MVEGRSNQWARVVEAMKLSASRRVTLIEEGKGKG
jgi:hypothetical protein